MIERIMKQQSEKYIANLKVNIMQMIEHLDDFTLNNSVDQIDDFRRYFHTMRGTAQTLHIKGLGIIGTRYEAELTQLVDKGAKAGEYLKVLKEGFTAVKQELDKFIEEQGVMDQAISGQEDSLEASEGKADLVEKAASMPGELKIEAAACILMLDDDQTLLELVKRILEKDGFNVYITTEYEEAEKLLKEASVDLFLVDLHMEGINGFEVLNRIRTQGIHTPTVVCTGDGTPLARERAIAEGALGIIVKPFKTRELALLIRSYFKI